MHIQTQPTLSDADYVRFRDLVNTASGLVFGPARRAELEHAVLRVAADHHQADLDVFYGLLSDGTRGRAALEQLITALTVGETYFFRNPGQFQALERHILPELIARRHSSRRLRIWSAGCASGEEPYSLAILLEHLLPNLADWDVLIVGSDINRQALDKARRGLYGAWSFRQMPSALQSAYFIQREATFEMLPRIRRMVRFIYLNLVDDVYPSLLTNTYAMDLIVCRNVTIYFDAQTTARVVDKFHLSLADGGWLLVGHAELSQTMFRQFAMHTFPGTVASQKVADAPLGDAEPDATGLSSGAPSPARSFPQVLARPAHERQPMPSNTRSAQTSPTRPSAAHAAPRPAVTERTDPAAWEAGRADEALQHLADRARSDPHDGQAPYLAAKISADRSELDAAERWIAMAIQRAPLLSQAHYLHGMILQERGQFEAALAALRRCVFADPQFVLGHAAMASLHARLEQWDRAQKALDNVTRLLAPLKREDTVPEGDGLTVGRLRALVDLQRRKWQTKKTRR